MPSRTQFSNKRIIICEGEEDAAFIRALIKINNLAPFDISPIRDIGNVGGNTGFKNAILAADAINGFEKVTDVVIVADNDDDPATSFKSVIEQIRNAKQSGLSRSWAVPTTAGVKAAGDPSVAIWLWPDIGLPGCLETLLWQSTSAGTKHQVVKTCVEHAIRCAGITDWPPNKLDKAKIRCFIALFHRENPAVSLSLVWSRCRHYQGLFDVHSSQFQSFLQFLRSI